MRCLRQECIIKILVEVLFGIIFSGLLSGYKKLAGKLKEQDAIKLGIQTLLRNRIIQSYNHYQDKGYCPIYVLENKNALYTQYHSLCGKN